MYRSLALRGSRGPVPRAAPGGRWPDVTPNGRCRAHGRMARRGLSVAPRAAAPRRAQPAQRRAARKSPDGPVAGAAATSPVCDSTRANWDRLDLRVRPRMQPAAERRGPCAHTALQLLGGPGAVWRAPWRERRLPFLQPARSGPGGQARRQRAGPAPGTARTAGRCCLSASRGGGRNVVDRSRRGAASPARSPGSRASASWRSPASDAAGDGGERAVCCVRAARLELLRPRG